MASSGLLWRFLALLAHHAPSDSLYCYSCSSLVEAECSNLFGLFLTYDESFRKMKKDCSAVNSTACGTYLWIVKEPEVGTIAVDSDSSHHMSYIQRGCAFHPENEYCSLIKSEIIDVLNITNFDQKKHCKVCNETFCNSQSLHKFYNRGTDHRNPLIGWTIATSVLVETVWRNLNT